MNGFAEGVRSRRTEQEDIYPGSPESIRSAAEREAFIQAMHRRLGGEFENTKFAAKFEPDSGTVKVEEKQTGTERRSPVEVQAASHFEGNRKAGRRDEISAASAMADDVLGRSTGSTRVVEALVDSGTYRGMLLGETEHYLIQMQATGMAVLHEKNLLDGQPHVGEAFSINYSNGRGAVREFRERAKSNERSR